MASLFCLIKDVNFTEQNLNIWGERASQIAVYLSNLGAVKNMLKKSFLKTKLPFATRTGMVRWVLQSWKRFATIVRELHKRFCSEMIIPRPITLGWPGQNLQGTHLETFWLILMKLCAVERVYVFNDLGSFTIVLSTMMISAWSQPSSRQSLA